MLIAAATKAPDDPGEAARMVWDAYYANHQKNENFRKLKVADIFMGGGTTLVEGARLGMQMWGTDLNPVAWLVVKNEFAKVTGTQTISPRSVSLAVRNRCPRCSSGPRSSR